MLHTAFRIKSRSRHSASFSANNFTPSAIALQFARIFTFKYLCCWRFNFFPSPRSLHSYESEKKGWTRRKNDPSVIRWYSFLSPSGTCRFNCSDGGSTNNISFVSFIMKHISKYFIFALDFNDLIKWSHWEIESARMGEVVHVKASLVDGTGDSFSWKKKCKFGMQGEAWWCGRMNLSVFHLQYFIHKIFKDFSFHHRSSLSGFQLSKAAHFCSGGNLHAKCKSPRTLCSEYL